MDLRTNLTNLPARSEALPTPPTKPAIYARVVDIVLSEDHPDYAPFGKVEALGGIRYRIVDSSTEEQEPSNLPFAFPMNSHLKHLPLLDEIVEIREALTYSLESLEYFSKTYYLPSLNIWNNPNHNALPDVNLDKTRANLGSKIVERDNLSPLQPFPGDTIVEGRLGNSIRLSGYSHPRNIYSSEDNNGNPFIILKNSKLPSKTVLESSLEDVNTDDTTIYLTSNHTVPLLPISINRETFVRTSKVRYDYIPAKEDTFLGSQIIAKSDRIVIQAKRDSVLLSARESASILGKSVNLDSTEYLALNSNKIFLGNNAKRLSDQPILRGEDTGKWLEEVLDVFLKISKDFSKVTDPYSAVAILQKLGTTLPPTVNRLKSEISKLKSKKVFVE